MIYLQNILGILLIWRLTQLQCDEAHPRCGFCEKRNLNCDYTSAKSFSQRTPPESTSPQSENLDQESQKEDYVPFLESSSGEITRLPTPAIQTCTGVLDVSDMRAMHFWSLFTSQAIAPGTYAIDLLQMTVPQIAFEHEYLLDCLLGISSLHLSTLSPNPTASDRQQIDRYRSRAFSKFRAALPTVDVNKPGSWESALLTSILLTMLCARDFPVEEGDLISLHWINLYRGLSAVIGIGKFGSVLARVVAPLFKRSLTDLKISPIVPYALYQMLDNIPSSDPDFSSIAEYRKTLDCLGVLYASLTQDGITAPFQTRVVSWCSLNGAEFARLAREKRPRALILMAHYMVFVKCSKDIWWMVGVPDGDIQRIFKMVPVKFFPLLEIPRRALEIEDPLELRALMLE